MGSDAPISIGRGTLQPALAPDTLVLVVPDAAGTYALPYIQSSRELEVAIRDGFPDDARAALTLSGKGGVAATAQLDRGSPAARFPDLAPGEYSLRVDVGRGATSVQREIGGIGIGTVAAALGDSITEGYLGRGFRRGERLSWRDFPGDAVSADRRNFPQFAPTTCTHMPEVNCFESWLTALNDLLCGSLQHPVFIANEGWGGYGAGDYLRLMREDRNWQERIRLVEPDLWLIHLGVNDGRVRTSPGVVADNLAHIVGLLTSQYGARPDRIFLAKPCYDYFPGAAARLAAYCDRIEALVDRLGLASGPDFFAAYATDRARWYGEDPVHPNEQGMAYMAQLWHAAILAAPNNRPLP